MRKAKMRVRVLSSVPYPVDRTMALSLSGTKLFEELTFERFERLGEKAGADVGHVREVVGQSAATMRASWNELRDDLGLDAAARAAIDDHLAGLAL